MKTTIALLAAGAMIVSSTALNSHKERDYGGTYRGIYWSGHAKGVSLEESKKRIETVLTLDRDGTILDAEVDFLVLKKGKWIARNDSEASVSVDFSADPGAATVGTHYKKGRSMFDIKTNDMMGFYAVAVDEDGTVALVIVDAVIRYQLEAKFEPGYNYNSKVKELTINEELIPTKRTSKSGLVKVKDWSEVEGENLYSLHPYNHVIKDRGALKGIDEDSNIMEMLTALGVEFKDGVPQKMEVRYGFHSNGGWEGNYDALEEYLIGKDAKEVRSLIDWSSKKYSRSIDDNNYFGLDSAAGATRTAQDSVDGIGGSTVRMSRENTSYMLVLVEAGIIDEEDVIKGRF